MLNDLVQMILEEANSRKGHDLVFHIYRVMRELDAEIIKCIDKFRAQEKREKGL